MEYLIQRNMPRVDQLPNLRARDKLELLMTILFYAFLTYFHLLYKINHSQHSTRLCHTEFQKIA